MKRTLSDLLFFRLQISQARCILRFFESETCMDVEAEFSASLKSSSLDDMVVRFQEITRMLLQILLTRCRRLTKPPELRLELVGKPR